MRIAGKIGLLALLVGGIFHSASAQQPGSAPTPVRVATVQEQHYADRIEALGTLRANESLTLTTNVTETITAIHFTDGQRVKQGDVLAEMTSAEEHAQLKEARAALDEADKQYRRFQELVGKGAASSAMLDQRKRDFETAQARLKAVESRLSDRLITAPFDGITGLRNLSVGALVEPGDPIATLDDDGVMKLDFSVPAIYLAQLQPGLAVEAGSRAYEDKTFTGTISAVDSRIDPVTRAVTVRAEIPNPEGLLKPGLLMQVSIAAHPRSALVIPESAILGDGGKNYVLALDDSAEAPVAQKKEVTLGTRRAGTVEVLSGLNAGDRVITHGMMVRPGQKVEIQEAAGINNGADKQAP